VRVEKVIAQAKTMVTSEEKQRLNDGIFELQGASRVLTSVMLYTPIKAASSEPTPPQK
jgi:hypothetical protein